MNVTPCHCPVCHPDLFVSSRPVPRPGRAQSLDHVWGSGRAGTTCLFGLCFCSTSFCCFHLPKQTWLPPLSGIPGEEDGVPVPWLLPELKLQPSSLGTVLWSASLTAGPLVYTVWCHSLMHINTHTGDHTTVQSVTFFKNKRVLRKDVPLHQLALFPANIHAHM